MSAILRGNLRMALSGVKASKWRSVLTMMGVIVGVVAVVTVVGLGEGVKKQIAGTLDHFGKDLILVRPKADGDATSSAAKTDVVFGMNSVAGLNVADGELVKTSTGVKYSSPLIVLPGDVTVDGRVVPHTAVMGVSADLAILLRQTVPYGDFWSSKEEESSFAVLGRKAAQTLFGEPVPLGKSINFRGQKIMVRGVFDPFLQTPFSPTANFDSAVFIPYKTGVKLTNNTAQPYIILAKPGDAGDLKPVLSHIQTNLNRAHSTAQDFQVIEASKSLANGNSMVQLLTVWIMAVAVISLLMGGVGIMNTMLLVVTERMYEIGVRKAIGATSRQIMGQFVMEATVISVVGGFIGIAVSLVVIGLLNVYTDLRPVVSWHAVGIAFAVSVLVGIIFGTIPAVKAARKDPIEALRHE